GGRGGFGAGDAGEDLEEDVACRGVGEGEGAEEAGAVEFADAFPADVLAGEPGLGAAVVLVAGLVEVAGAVEGVAGGVDVPGGEVPLGAGDGVGEEVADGAEPG